MLFCDLAGSTALTGRLDPEDYREVVRAYHQICAEVLQRFDGYVAHMAMACWAILAIRWRMKMTPSERSGRLGLLMPRF